MNVTIDQKGDSKVAIVKSSEILLGDVQSALDLMAVLRYDHECHKIIVHQSNVAEDFFDLKTRLAGDILQKFTNYGVQIALVGDFEAYNSKSLRDFIYECNQGRQVFFLKDEEAALQALHRSGGQ
ncbi:DUF4180 domain-containing protein [Tumebacillus flagellatus]|uniref:DUF4180 domain-containing protein n=1 Tax=Tumebacillus flagellatus TaxID=1157490 RepID=A0A074LSX7_9BACL|nr:DUF4180 domain-containing protein [Tumebacillus flagellatus]KEO85286.1 hypothetical protein EL26_01635 [Tumebacillus flagellatus]